MLTLTSSCGSFAISSSIASSDPATSALTTSASSLTVPSWASLNTSSRDTLRPERYLCGHSVEEVARLLGIPCGTVKSRSYYALRALRTVLQERGVHLGS